MNQAEDKSIYKRIVLQVSPLRSLRETSNAFGLGGKRHSDCDDDNHDDDDNQ